MGDQSYSRARILSQTLKCGFSKLVRILVSKWLLVLLLLYYFSIGSGFLHHVGSLAKRHSKTALKTITCTLIFDWIFKIVYLLVFYGCMGNVASML